MAENSRAILADEYHQLIQEAEAEPDDESDAGLALEQFRQIFMNESDTELERKRGIMRNRLLARYGDPEMNKARHDILSTIIQNRFQSRQQTEAQRDVSTWVRWGLGYVISFIGGFLIAIAACTLR